MSRKFIGVRGLKQLGLNFRRFEKAMQEEVQDLVRKTAIKVHGDAVRSIQRGPKTGRVYKRKGKTHRASAPGQAPATDSGALASSVAMVHGKMESAVGTGLESGPHLEFGTATMEERPWLFPALEKNRAFYEDGVKQIGVKAKKRMGKE